MGDLEERFFAEKGKTLVSPGDENAPQITEILKRAIKKGCFVQRGGAPTSYMFNFDLIY